MTPSPNSARRPTNPFQPRGKVVEKPGEHKDRRQDFSGYDFDYKERANLVKRSHGGAGGRDDVVDEEEERVFGSEVDSFSDEEVELADGQVGRNQIFLFVQVADASLRRLLHNHRHAGQDNFILFI